MTNKMQGNPKRLSADFSREILQAKSKWHNIVEVVKARMYNQEYSNQQGSHSDLMEKSEFLFFLDKQQLEFNTTIPALQQILK